MNQAEVLELTKTFPETPLFNKVIITVNLLEADGGLVLSDSTLSDVQYIVAKGDHVHQLELGDAVRIDLEKLTVKVPVDGNSYEYVNQVKIDPIILDGVLYAIIEDRFIKTKFKTV